MPPVNPLLLRFNAMPSLISVPKDEGILPPRMLPPSCSSISISNCDRESGKPPLNLFSCKRSCDIDLRLLTVVSAEPFKKLKLKSSRYNLEHPEISSGISPYSLFPERLRLTKLASFPISGGIGPTSLFPDQFTYVTLIHLLRLAGMSPLKKL
uniref:Uncharacterized protein n=1 Tax=Oryza brachyantha TaxID=4533 RepID=J3MTG6_ORYBR